MTDQLRQEIIREVIEELVRRGFVLPAARRYLAAESDNNTGEAAAPVTEKNIPPFEVGQVLTEEKVESAAASRNSITVSSSVVITPLARDRAKKLELEIIVQ